MGETKVKESLSRIFNAGKLLFTNDPKNKLGIMNINLNEPLSLKTYCNQLKNTNNNITNSKIIGKLGYQLVHNLQESLIISPSAILSTTLLQNFGGIHEEHLINQIKWVLSEIKLRNGITS
jgi:glycerol-3-phosphate O-acyltransferase